MTDFAEREAIEQGRVPDRTNPKDLLGIKKPLLHLVPAALVLWVSKVFQFSAGKYGPYNWRKNAVRKSIYLDAIERHLLAMKDGQWYDPETKLPHASHIGANVAIILDAEAIGNLIDDMPWEKGPATSIIRGMTEEPANAKPAQDFIPKFHDVTADADFSRR